MRGPDILVVEDDENFIKLIDLTLRLGGLMVSEKVCWMAELRARIDEGKLPKVLTLDNDIFGGSLEKNKIIPLIRRKCPEAKLIGLSCCPMYGVDVDLRKENLKILPDVIRKFSV